eukprot:7529749-Alexandrium_andersonii.AAC.1
MPRQLRGHREATKRAATGLGRTALQAPQHALAESLATSAPLGRLLGLRRRAEGALRVTRGLRRQGLCSGLHGLFHQLRPDAPGLIDGGHAEGLPGRGVEGDAAPVRLQEVAQRLLLHAVRGDPWHLRAREPAGVRGSFQAGLEGGTNPLMICRPRGDDTILDDCEQL